MYHAGVLEDRVSSNPELVATFRPLSEIRDESLAELMEALSVVCSSIALESAVSRRLAFALWWVCQSARVLILDPECVIRKSKKIDTKSIERIKCWIDAFETASLRALQGLDKRLCMARFLEYLAAFPPEKPSVYGFCHSIIQECRSCGDEDIVEIAERAAKALELGT